MINKIKPAHHQNVLNSNGIFKQSNGLPINLILIPIQKIGSIAQRSAQEIVFTVIYFRPQQLRYGCGRGAECLD